MDLDLVQPQEGEYVVALYEFPHHPCRILDPQRCWAGGGDVRMSVISLSANLGSTWNQSYTWNQGWTTGLCHSPPRMKIQRGSRNKKPKRGKKLVPLSGQMTYG